MAGTLRTRVLSVRSGGWLVIAALVLGSSAQAFAQACAMCVTTIGGPEDPLAKAMRVSIMFLMAMPFLMFASVAGWIGYMQWRSQRNGLELEVLQEEKEGAL